MSKMLNKILSEVSSRLVDKWQQMFIGQRQNYLELSLPPTRLGENRVAQNKVACEIKTSVATALKLKWYE